ncbi:MAG: HAD-IA family hydrolase [Pseudomonadota bacterium]
MKTKRNLSGITLAFDLDGTLIDTAPDLIATAGAVLDAHGFSQVPDAVMRPQISFGSRAMLEAALRHQGRVDALTDLNDLFDAFLAHYRDHIADHSTPFPGVIDVIERARADGARIAVCTNKLESLSRDLLEKLGMTALFDAIAGRDTYDIHKPDPGHLTRVISDAGGDPELGVMVGDSETDIATAKAASLPVIAVTFGYTSIPVEDLDPNDIVSSYGHFDGALNRVLSRPHA